MENQVPFSTVYFCGNCEDEVVGLPAGARLTSGRPLCLRCAQIGEEEGWGRSNRLLPDEHLYEPTRKRGIILLIILMVLAGFAYFVLSTVFGDRR